MNVYFKKNYYAVSDYILVLKVSIFTIVKEDNISIVNFQILRGCKIQNLRKVEKSLDIKKKISQNLVNLT